jgi:hypothetical protein
MLMSIDAVKTEPRIEDGGSRIENRSSFNQFKQHRLEMSFQHGVLESRLHGCSGGILANWMLAIHASYDDDLYSRVLRASAS